MNGSQEKLPFLRRLSPGAFAALALVLIFVLYQGVGNVAVLLLTGGRMAPETVAVIRWTTLFGELLLMLVPTLILVRRRHGNIADALRVKAPGALEVALVVVATIALQQVVQGYMSFQDMIPIPEPLGSIVERVRKAIQGAYLLVAEAHSLPEFFFVLTTVALMPAIAEEFLFRGLVQQSVSEPLGRRWGAVVAGLLFGFYHLNPFSIVPLVCLGVFFGYIMYRSGSLLLAVVAHFVNNAVACAALYLQLPEDSVMIQPEGGATPGTILLNMFAFGVLLAGVMTAFRSMTKGKESHPASE
jgi:hypothetical protein